MDKDVWRFEHTVDCAVPQPMAWAFWTDVKNWMLDADLESIEIDGPFAAGAHGVTASKSAGRIEWRVAEAEPGRAAIESAGPGVVARFEWTFTAVQGRTHIRQQASLSGEQASHYVASFGRGLEQGIPAGMQALCKAMQAAAAQAGSALPD